MRALLVSYTFPPVGGAGVGRVLKLSKYLPHHGVETAVLTTANPSVPVIDHSLERDLRPDVRVLRARTLEPGYGAKRAAWSSAAGSRRSARAAIVGAASTLARQALIPDPQILWLPAAAGALGRRLAGPAADDVVFISGPPFSQFLLAPLARLRPGTAVVLDYRDEWTTSRTAFEMAGRAGAWLGGPLERALLRTAHAVTTATEGFRRNLLAQLPFLAPERVHAIPNGYDPDDFPRLLPEPPRDRFVITYAGTVWKLASARGLLRGVARLHRSDPELARLLRVRFLGRIVETERSSFACAEALGVEQVGYLDKEHVARELAASHVAVCLLADAPGTERIYPAKIFELMYLGRPVLTLAPRGELAALAATHRLGPVLHPDDEEGIAAALAAMLRAFRDGHFRHRAPAEGIERFHRRAQAAEFAQVFEQAVQYARGLRPWRRSEDASARSTSSRPRFAVSTSG